MSPWVIWLLLFEVRLITAITKTGYLGGSVTVPCSRWRTSSDYLCRYPCLEEEHTLLKYGQTIAGRYRLQDSGKEVSVIISGLEKSDARSYWCGDNALMDPKSKVELQINDGPAPSSTQTPTSTATPLRISISTVFPSSTRRPSIGSTVPSTDLKITAPKECQVEFTEKCGDSVFDQILNISAPELSQDVVSKYLDLVLNAQEQLVVAEANNSDKLAYYGNSVVNRTEKLVSTLVKSTDTNYSISMSLKGLDIQIFAIGPNALFNTMATLGVKDARMDINLLEISQKNKGSAAVAFMSYSNISDMLKPSLFSTSKDTEKTMMSTVVSATLPKTTITRLTQPVNFTLTHIHQVDPEGHLSCVYWRETEWVVDGCSISQTNSSHTVCSCVHLSTFALIMQTDPNKGNHSDAAVDLVNTVAVVVGLLFLSLTLFTFAWFGKNPRVTSTARTHLCICLFLAHLLQLFTQKLLKYIRYYQWLCATLAGILHFAFLSAFVWMFLDAAVLFTSVKNLARLRCNHQETLNWKGLLLIGYTVPLVVVGVAAAVQPGGYGSEQCWLKDERNFTWSFLGPVSFILVANTIFFISILIFVASTLKRMQSDAVTIKPPKSDQVFVTSVILKTLIQFFILGCPWILGFFINSSKVLELFFIILNSQQGTFIFLIHCVLNKEVTQVLGKWLRAHCAA